MIDDVFVALLSLSIVLTALSTLRAGYSLVRHERSCRYRR